MALSTTLKQLANDLLKRINVRIDSCTAERAEMARLAGLVAKQHFERPIFPVLPQFERCDPKRLIDFVHAQERAFAKLTRSHHPVGFDLQNEYYSSPDAEILYALVALYRPKRIIEVGSGNSTRLFRAAIEDAKLATRLVSIDPHPRLEVRQYADDLLQVPVETMNDLSPFDQLAENDILFIDSSHAIQPGNDVIFLFLNVLPRLRRGVLVHIHDIFLPFEYPEEWLVTKRWEWNEQYLVQALLQDSDSFIVIWPGYYLQRTMKEFSNHFPLRDERNASSIWLVRGIDGESLAQKNLEVLAQFTS
jgi:predicted O-methyltransferase YrrM